MRILRWVQSLIALAPLLLTPILIYALAEGIVDFGGGEKDVILALPWLVWSLSFAVCGLVFIIRRWPFGRWLRRSTLVATIVLLGLFAIAYASSYLGIG